MRRTLGTRDRAVRCALCPILALLIFLAPASGLSFDGARAKEHVERIASDRFEGRKSGLKGGVMIEEYVASQFEKSGLEPLGDDGSYFQEFPLLATEELRGEMELLDSPFGPVSFQLGDDFTLITNSGSADVTTDVEIIGHGLSDDGKEWNDYGELDVSGKIVLIVRGAPENGYDWSAQTPRDSTMKEALARGAVGVLWYARDEPVNGAAIHVGVYDPEVPLAYVGRRVVSLLLRGTGYNIDRYKEELEENPVPLSSGKRLHFTTEVKDHGELRARNVLGLLRGSDPIKSSEVLLVGGHMDHVGINASGIVYNGADDNGSGTGVVLELARSLAGSDDRPARSILFATFAGEEQGLLGSKFFVDNPTVEIADIAAMFNFDMVGQGDGNVGIGGGEYFPGLWEAFLDGLDEERAESLKVGIAWEGGGSDHAPFRDKGVPAVSIWSEGEHRFYHGLEDDPEWVDQNVLGAVGRMAEGFVRHVGSWEKTLLSPRRPGRTLLYGSLQVDFDGTSPGPPMRYQVGRTKWYEARHFGKDAFAMDVADMLSRAKNEDTVAVASSFSAVHENARNGRRSVLFCIEGNALEALPRDRFPLLGTFGTALSRWPEFSAATDDSARMEEEQEFFADLALEGVAILVTPDTAWIEVLPESSKSYVRIFPGLGEIVRDPDAYPRKSSLFIVSLEQWMEPGEMAELIGHLGIDRVHIDLVRWIAKGEESEVCRFLEELQEQDDIAPKQLRRLLGRNLMEF